MFREAILLIASHSFRQDGVKAGFPQGLSKVGILRVSFHCF